MNAPAIAILENMVERDLQLAWDHLQNGQCDLALRELANAAEKVSQIKELRAQSVEMARPIIEINTQQTLAISHEGQTQS